jgi:hypothetical protein
MQTQQAWFALAVLILAVESFTGCVLNLALKRE